MSKKPNFGTCHYHLCGKAERLFRCKYCGESFCRKNLYAKPPGLHRFKSTNYEDRQFIETWKHKPIGHPCAPYLEYWEEIRKRENQKYGEALDSLLGNKLKGQDFENIRTERASEYRKRPDIFIKSKPLNKIDDSVYAEEDTPRKVPLFNKLSSYWNFNKSDVINFVGSIIVLFMLVFFGIYISNNSELLDEAFEKIKIDLESNVEKIKTEFSQNSEQITGAFSIEPENKEEAKEAFIYVNQLREEYGRKKISWNDNLYELAIFRAKDMYERNYFDHVTPEGKCVDDFKAEYGLSRYNIAENVGAKYEGYSSYDMQFSLSIDPKEQVDGWMGSRGHRYNLLYPQHVMGAIGCYYGVCVFLGANTEYYGLGYGPCTTGEQGLDYWRTASLKPDEIVQS